ncbi:MAG: FAD-dependent oxidoreductase [Pseudorhodoplanes sp.]
MKTRSAEIAGGGIAGLAIGWGLARYGWRVRIHERASEIREIGAGILLMNNSLSIFDHYGIADLILHRAVPISATERREYDGRLIERRALPGADRWTAVPRADLVNGLAEAARREGAEIITNSTAVSADPSGTLTLESGEVARADLVIAADGFRSRLRDQLGLTLFAKERGSGATRLLLPRTKAEAEPIAREYWSGKMRVGITPCTPDITYVYMSCPNDDLRGAAVPIDAAYWQDAFPGIPDFFHRMPQVLAVTRHPYAHAVSRAWSNGQAALIGDAAHSFPPTLGQGAGMAIFNGYALVRMLEKGNDISETLKEWETRFRWVADRTQRWSLAIDALTTHWPRPLSVMRRSILWAIGRSKKLNSRVRVADRIRLVGAHF